MNITTAITDNYIGEAVAAAERKLSLIIKNEGDSDGIRCEPWYFDMLVKEELRAIMYADKLSQKIKKSPVGMTAPTEDRT